MADLKLNKDLWLSGATSFDYTRLEYIESNGGQYFSMGYCPSGMANVRIQTRIMHNEDTIDSPIFGSRASNSANSYTLWSHTSDNPTYKTATGVYNSYQMTSLTPYPKNTIIDIDYGNYYLKYGDRTYSGSKVNDGYNGYYMMLFTINNWGTVDDRRFSGRMYYFKVWEGSKIVRDFIPAKRNSDGAVGMYDATCGQFFTNEGTGSFTAGPSAGPMQISQYDPNVESMEGNLRLVGWGVTDTVGISATTWSNRGLNGGAIVYDDRYVYTTNGRNLYTKVAGYYFLVWQYRPSNISASQGCGVRLNSETMGDSKLYNWGGGGGSSPYRTMLYGFEGAQLAADTLLSMFVYFDAADTLHPANLWVYAVEDGSR